MGIALSAGQLRHLVNIEQKGTPSADGHGNSRQTWTAIHNNIPVEILPLSSRELWAGEQSKTQGTHRIKLRHLSGLNTDMRVVFGSRVFSITGITNVEERNVTLELLTQEEVS